MVVGAGTWLGSGVGVCSVRGRRLSDGWPVRAVCEQHGCPSLFTW